tara:strand:- start:344 stop:598 length:255 start_codon:yes stop_codon:yes gene_type:complete
MNEHEEANYERYMMRMEIGELNKTLENMQKNSSKTIMKLATDICDLQHDLRQLSTSITRLANAIRSSTEIKIVIDEDEWSNESL